MAAVEDTGTVDLLDRRGTATMLALYYITLAFIYHFSSHSELPESSAVLESKLQVPSET